MTVKLCNRCVLPATFPGISFSPEGICNYCADFEKKNVDFDLVRIDVETQVKAKLSGVAKNHYGIILAFSGGKDSCYTLKYLAENFDTKILAYTINNDFISETAKQNCETVTSHLGVDHIFFKPNAKVMMEVYRTSLKQDIYSAAASKRASSVCNSCIQLINNQVVNFAIEQKIPVIAGGYLGGQIPSETGFMKQNLAASMKSRTQTLENFKNYFQNDALAYFQQKDSPDMREVWILNPMTYLNLHEDAIIKEIETLGWVRPPDTGKSSSNCLLNDYAIQKHLEKWQFHPYVAETAVMVRRGTISRQEGFDKMKFKAVDTAPIEKKLNRFT